MFSCNYQTMARLARIEARELERAESDGCYLPIRDARDYALLAEAARRDDAQKLQDFKDATFHKALGIVSHMYRTHGLTDAERIEIQSALNALVEAIM